MTRSMTHTGDGDSASEVGFSIGKIVSLLAAEYPDVTQSSLRFLEREGLLKPARSAGGHRLFNQADVQRVRQIKEWQAQRLSLDEIRDRLADLDAVRSSVDLANEFLMYGLAGDAPAARRTILNASAIGMPLDTLLIDVLRPALYELGSRWERGDASVAQEKEVSEIARELIADLSLGAAKSSEALAVAACVSGERHELGLRTTCGLLGARGVGVHFLGADVATGFLSDAVASRRTGIVLLSVTINAHLPALREAVDALDAGSAPPDILAGGQAVVQNRDLVSSWGVVPVMYDNLDSLATTLRARA